MNKRISQNASNPNHPLTEDSVPNAKLHRRSIENVQQSVLGGTTDNTHREMQKLASVSEVRIATPNQAKHATIAQNLDGGDTSQFQFGTVEQNNAVMQLALSNLLGGLQNQATPQQQIATINPTPANINLYLQLLQLHQQQQQPQQQPNRVVGGLNPLSQALWTAIASQQPTNMLSEYSSETDASGRFTSGGTTNGLSGGLIGDKQQGRLLVPCRARGMSVEHNFQTAYFEISPDIKHGDGLICSFPACRNRGVKFLYCAYCKDPVAKRNFRNQHSHTEGEGTTVAVPSMQQSNASATAVKQSNHNDTTTTAATSKKRKMDARQGGVTDGGADITSWLQSSSSGGLKMMGIASGNASSSEGDKSASERSSANDETSQKIASIDKARRSAWERLLVTRPGTDQNEELAAWLIRVMAVSDLKKPFRCDDEENAER